MKARSKELLDRAVAATVAAIEIYNKPDFLYRHWEGVRRRFLTKVWWIEPAVAGSGGRVDG